MIEAYQRKNEQQQYQLLRSMIFPVFMLLIMWGVFIWETVFLVSFNTYGIYPRDLIGLRGILFSPFIHSDFQHIINNSYPVLILGTAIFYFYRRSAKYVLLYSFLMTGIWVWAMGRSSFHIGASGLIYAWGAFLFTSGVLNRNKRMMGLSLLVVFLYGSMIWGVLPLMPEISWESHLFGAIAGTVLAFVFKKEGPKKRKYDWETNEEEYEIEFWNMTQEEINQYYIKKAQEKTSGGRPEVSIKYDFKPKKDD